MRIIHMADSHLGFSAYNKVDQFGRNIIEEKVYEGFKQTIDKIIDDIHPDAIIHAGDVFHHVRPRIRTLYIFKKEIEKLNRNKIPTIIISGNHDAPKSSSTTSPFSIFEGLEHIHIVHNNEYQGIPIEDYVFHCIPFCLNNDAYLDEFSKIRPTGSDVLVMHGLIESIRDKRLRTVGEHELSDSFLKRYFSYIALGHYHNQAQVAENAWYSGSIEYFNFGEASDRKGILQVDLDTHKVEQIDIISKYMFDHPPIDCSGFSSKELAEKLLNLCDEEEIKDKIIRINLVNVSKAAFKGLDQSNKAKLGSSALFLKIKVEYIDEKDKYDKQLDSTRLDEAFSRFLDEESQKDRIRKAITNDVVAYGTDVMKKAALVHNTRSLNASE
jgi:DNA repair exonuclease SbcCD nuclease subunit